MKTFAGVNLNTVDKIDLEKLYAISRCFIAYTKSRIDQLHADPHADPLEKAELEFLLDHKPKIIAYLANYTALKVHEDKLATARLVFPEEIDSLGELFKLALVHAPVDYNVQGTIRYVEMLVREYEKSPQPEVLEKLEELMRAEYKKACARNLELAYAKVNELSDLINKVHYEKNITFQFALEICHLSKVLKTIKLWLEDDAELCSFALTVLQQINGCINALQILPEIEPETAVSLRGYLGELLFSPWHRESPKVEHGMHVVPRLLRS